MTEGPINLNKVRKARERARDRAQADANAAKHGRSKARTRLEAACDEKARRALDGLKREE
jgi:hypothetical protein